MVNRELLRTVGSNKETESHFPAAVHQKLFYILLIDFLSKNTDDTLLPGNLSVLDQVSEVANQPLLSTRSEGLLTACDALQEWLQAKVDVKVWASTLDMELILRLTRREIIYFAGNMSKHHYGHLTAVTNQLYKLLDDRKRPRHDIIPALESIYATLHDDILNYHASTITELLNNVRWGIHDYLKPEFARAYRKVDSIHYEFELPKDIATDFASSCYWDLMNSVGAKPYIDKFVATDILKLRY
jgi:hypothetical protein